MDARARVRGFPAGFSAANSNTRPGDRARPDRATASVPSATILTSDRLRERMVQSLAARGIQSEPVLSALAQVHRHRFVDEALASRAYEPVSLPIGHGQTISQPWVVAYMAQEVYQLAPRRTRVLEIGTGCGYQAAVLSHLFAQVVSLERIRALHEAAARRLAALGFDQIRLLLADGSSLPEGLPKFDAIVSAAAAEVVPQSWLEALTPDGGVLVAPRGGESQQLVRVVRRGRAEWHTEELQSVKFVPLRSGLQT